MSTISKALRLLDLFTAERPAIGLSEFQRLTGSSKATLHRHLQALLTEGFLEQDARSGRYRLGPSLTRLAAQRAQGFSMRDAVKPFVDALSRQVGELVHCSVFDGTGLQAIYFAQHHDHALRVLFEESESIPLHATSSGIALVARLPEAEWPDLIAPPLARFTEHTPTDPAALLDLLRDVRQAGHSEMSETREAGVNSLGAAILDETGRPCAAISITYPSQRDAAVRERGAIAQLTETAKRLTEALGGRWPLSHGGAALARTA